LNCGAGEEWRSSVAPIERKKSATNNLEERITALVISGVETAFKHMFIYERWKGRKGEDEDVTRYSVTLRKQDTGN
jgi:hypothetical protein